MNIEKYIPDDSGKWVYKHKTIYFKKVCLIPMMKVIDGIIFVSLDRRVTKQNIKLIKKLQSMNENYLFCDRVTIDQKHIHYQDFERIIDNYLYMICDNTFFYFLKESNFDYIRNFTNFLETYGCFKPFKKRFELLKNNHFNKVWINWFTMAESWNVPNEEVRDYFSTIERQIKLNIFFS
jgi:hypothetical protein